MSTIKLEFKGFDPRNHHGRLMKPYGLCQMRTVRMLVSVPPRVTAWAHKNYGADPRNRLGTLCYSY